MKLDVMIKDPVEVRVATTDDATNIAALMIQVWLHTYATDGLRDVVSNYVLTQFTPGRVASAISSPAQLHLLAERDDHLVGLAVVDWEGICPVTNNAMPALQKLYVQEHFTGRGFGKVLLEHSIERCRARKLTTLWLTVKPSNVRAVKFYAKNGFRNVGKTDFILGEELHENYVLHRSL